MFEDLGHRQHLRERKDKKGAFIMYNGGFHSRGLLKRLGLSVFLVLGLLLALALLSLLVLIVTLAAPPL
jgi:hypothetical protein